MTHIVESKPERTPLSTNILSRLVYLTSKKVQKALVLFWLFTVDDAGTFVIPNVVFGLCSALSAPVLATPQNDAASILVRLPRVIFFNWSNLLIFDLANQRLPESAQEDALNKPWRPAPGGLVTSAQIRRAMLVWIPIVLITNHIFGVGTETSQDCGKQPQGSPVRGLQRKYRVKITVISSEVMMRK
ncbi:hypothetical protein F4815DRAFT_476693 [Daldinia loculata]|nr:hypothetical protein F4815DRAFT_476693 [Daldinia loculata]